MTPATRELVARAVHALRKSAVWWCVALVAFVVLNLAFWPSFRGTDMLESFEDMGSVMEAFGAADIASPAGYLDGQVFALMLPLMLSAMAIATTTAVTSGDEGAGRLELLHALPVSRTAVWLARWAAAAVALVAVAAVVFVALAVCLRVFSFDGVGVAQVAGPTLGCTLLALFHGSIGYAAGAFGWPRGRSVSLAVVVLAAGYVAAFILPLADSLTVARTWSPWYWAVGTSPAVDGVAMLPLLGLVVATAALVWLGTVGLSRRDIRSA